VLTSDSASLFHLAIVVDAASFLVTGGLVFACGNSASTHGISLAAAPIDAPKPALDGTSAWSNGPFIALVVFNGLLCLHDGILSVGIPLWVSMKTQAFPMVISAVIILNTIGIASAQVWMTRWVRDFKSATKVAQLSGVALTLACLLISGTSVLSATWATVIVLLAGILHLAGELLQSSSSWAIAFDAAPDSRIGEYQGVLNAGMDAGSVISPILLAWVVTDSGNVGWLVLAALFLSLAALFPAAATRVVLPQT
jgi:hypothetical protein